MVKVNNTIAILVAYAKVFWRDVDNLREDYGSPKERQILADSLAEQGWNVNHPVSVYRLPKEQMAERLKECLMERQAKWDALKLSKEANSGLMLQIFEQLFVDSKTKKLVEPEFLGNAGFRRASCFEQAMSIRWLDKSIPDDEKIVDSIPVIVKQYANDFDRILDQQLENEMKDRGTKETSDKEKLRTARTLYQIGSKEVVLRRLYTTSTGQKLFGICEAETNWPELDIYNRTRLDEGDPRQIPLKRIKAADIVKLNNRYEADQARLRGEKLTEAKAKLEPLAVNEARDYFANLRSPGETVVKSMSRTDLEAFTKQNPVGFFKVMSGSVLQNSTGDTVRYTQFAESLNLHKQLIDEGKGDLVTQLLKMASNYPLSVDALGQAAAVINNDEQLSRVLRQASMKVQPTFPVTPVVDSEVVKA